jgi:HD-GYP domain-containing protein (c-di-GMP phosphodiesterase class II)
MDYETSLYQKYSKETRDIFLQILYQRDFQQLRQLKDHHTDSLYHSYNVGLICLDIALGNRYTDGEVRDATVAGLLHDVGKDVVPVEILSKASELDDDEWCQVQKHSLRGYAVLQELGEHVVKKIVAGHHENQPGPYRRKSKPYDPPPKGQEERRDYDPVIIKLTELLSIADMYESFVSERPYKPAIIEPLSLEDQLRGQFTGSRELLEQVIQRYIRKM